MELSETAAILDAIMNFSKRSTLQGVHPADSERVHPRLPKLINKNTLHKISGFFILLPDYKSRIKNDASLNVCADCGQTSSIYLLAQLIRRH